MLSTLKPSNDISRFHYNQGENADIFGTEIDADLADSGTRAGLC